MTMSAADAPADSSSPPVELEGLGYGGRVRLKGRLAERVADAAETYGGMAVDDVLKGFRRRAGLPTPGQDMTGWATESTEATFGQWLSGLARLSAVLMDGALAERVGELVDGYAETVAPSYDPGMHTYGWEKLVCGLVDAAVYAGNDQALPLLSKVVRAERFDRTRATAKANDFSGDEPTWTIEWYTLSENLYRGFQASGDAALYDAARTWHYDSYWSRFRERPPRGATWDIPAWLHAYSHVNTFASVAAAYSVHGEREYLDILRNAHDWLAETQNFATGGFGPHEFTMPEDGSLGRSLEWVTDSAEITCGSWAAFKMCSALLRYTGEARYAEWIEQLVYNGIGATAPVRPDGRTPYYADYRLGVATKLPYWNEWPCCSGTYVQAVAHLADLVYYGTTDGLAIALYVPSEVTWTHDSREVTLRQDTTFPEGGESTFHLDAGGPIELTLRLRVPAWATEMSLELNGAVLDVQCSPGEWAVVHRTWRPEDVLVVRPHAQLRALPVDAFHPNRVAMAFGPVVLAQDSDWVTPFNAPVPWQMLDWETHLTRQGSELLFLPTAPGTHRMEPGLFRPFYDVPERRPYRIYHELGAPRIV
jgi:uncharacterized protein